MKPTTFMKKSDIKEKRKKIKSESQSQRRDKKSQRRGSTPKQNAMNLSSKVLKTPPN